MRTQGFTLIEVLVVVIIVTTLTAIALPSYRRAMERSHAAEVVQMLPALFEARERWLMINLCRWSNGSLNGCVYDDNLTLEKLDIELPYAPDLGSNFKFTTPNYIYNLVATADGINQPCVSATANWEGRLKGKVTIYYRGDKFSCTETQAGLCDILDITPDGEDYRKGCI